MAPRLTPDRAARWLRELSADLVAVVVLDATGAAVAGVPGLAAPGRALLEEAGAAGAAEARARRHLVVVGRSATHAIVAVHTRHALAGLVHHDVRTVLGDLAGTSTAHGRAAGSVAPLSGASPAVAASVAVAEAAAAEVS